MPPILRCGNVNAGFVGFSQDDQVGYTLDIGPTDLGMAGMRRQEYIIETAHEFVVALQNAVLENPEHFAGKLILWDSIAMVKSRLCAPANVECTKNVRIRPIHDIDEFGPIIHFFKGKQFHRRAGDDETVEFLTAHLRKRFVMIDQVLLRDILGCMRGGVEQGDFHLER